MTCSQSTRNGGLAVATRSAGISGPAEARGGGGRCPDIAGRRQRSSHDDNN
jgi:hypothetical protein